MPTGCLRSNPLRPDHWGVQSDTGRKRMIAIATAALAALVGAVIWISPPPEKPAVAALAAVPAVEPPVEPLEVAGPTVTGCADGVPCAGHDPLCFEDPTFPRGVCSRRCRADTECRAGWCCYDPHGAGDATYFVCAPPIFCEGRVTGTPSTPPIASPE